MNLSARWAHCKGNTYCFNGFANSVGQTACGKVITEIELVAVEASKSSL